MEASGLPQSEADWTRLFDSDPAVLDDFNINPELSPEFGAFDEDILLDAPLDGLGECEFQERLLAVPGGSGSPTSTAIPHTTASAGNNDKSSPATSESGVDHCQQLPKEDAVSPQGHSSDASEEEAKRLARMARNRENAHLSRQRKKQQMMGLQQQCAQYRMQQLQMTNLVQRLITENCVLRRHLTDACQKAGAAVPVVPSVAATPAAMAIMQQARGVQAATMMPPKPVVGPPFVPPMIALQQPQLQQPQQPTTTAAAAPQPAPAPAPQPSGRPTRKRTRTMTGAGAAFLTLFSIFMFVGPFMPAQNKAAIMPDATTTVTPMLPGSRGLEALPAAGMQHHGRSLMAVSNSGSQGLVSVEDTSGDDIIQLAPLASMMNQTAAALLADPQCRRAEESAFATLQELAPAAVLLDGPGESHSSAGNALEAHHAFPLLASSLFREGGLQAPQACTKVFEFDAASLPSNSRSRRNVEQFLMRSYGFKGLQGTLPLPAPLALDDGGGGIDEEREADLVAPYDSKEPLLVSVLLPANESDNADLGGSTLNVVDKVFVVLLNPQNKFVTYSCGLAKPLLV